MKKKQATLPSSPGPLGLLCVTGGKFSPKSPQISPQNAQPATPTKEQQRIELSAHVSAPIPTLPVAVPHVVQKKDAHPASPRPPSGSPRPSSASTARKARMSKLSIEFPSSSSEGNAVLEVYSDAPDSFMQSALSVSSVHSPPSHQQRRSISGSPIASPTSPPNRYSPSSHAPSSMSPAPVQRPSSAGPRLSLFPGQRPEPSPFSLSLAASPSAGRPQSATNRTTYNGRPSSSRSSSSSRPSSAAASARVIDLNNSLNNARVSLSISPTRASQSNISPVRHSDEYQPSESQQRTPRRRPTSAGGLVNKSAQSPRGPTPISKQFGAPPQYSRRFSSEGAEQQPLLVHTQTYPPNSSYMPAALSSLDSAPLHSLPHPSSPSHRRSVAHTIEPDPQHVSSNFLPNSLPPKMSHLPLHTITPSSPANQQNAFMFLGPANPVPISSIDIRPNSSRSHAASPPPQQEGLEQLEQQQQQPPATPRGSATIYMPSGSQNGNDESQHYQQNQHEDPSSQSMSSATSVHDDDLSSRNSTYFSSDRFRDLQLDIDIVPAPALDEPSHSIPAAGADEDQAAAYQQQPPSPIHSDFSAVPPSTISSHAVAMQQRPSSATSRVPPASSLSSLISPAASSASPRPTSASRQRPSSAPNSRGPMTQAQQQYSQMPVRRASDEPPARYVLDAGQGSSAGAPTPALPNRMNRTSFRWGAGFFAHVPRFQGNAVTAHYSPLHFQQKSTPIINAAHGHTLLSQSVVHPQTAWATMGPQRPQSASTRR